MGNMIKINKLKLIALTSCTVAGMILAGCAKSEQNEVVETGEESLSVGMSETLYRKELSYEDKELADSNAKFLEDSLGFAAGDGISGSYTLAYWTNCETLVGYEDKEYSTKYDSIFSIILIDSNGNKFYTVFDEEDGSIGPIQKDNENGEYLYAPVE